MSARGTGSNHDPIQCLFLYFFLNGFLGIIGTGIQVTLGIHHVRERLSIRGDYRYIDHTSNIGSAVTHKDSNSGPLPGYFYLGGVFPSSNPAAPGILE